MANKVTIKAVIERATAILAGSDTYGELEIHVDVSTLTDKQRQTLALLDEIREGRTLQKGVDAVCLPAVPADIANFLPAYLDSVAALLDKKTAEREALHEAAVAKLLAATPAEIEKHAMNRYGDLVAGPYLGNHVVVRALEADERLADVLQAARAIVSEKANEAKAKEEAARLARKAREEAAEAEKARKAAVRAQQIADWVRDYGTDGQKKRMARGLLPEEEVLRCIRGQVFAPLSDLPKYKKITADEVLESYGDEYADADDVQFSIYRAAAATDAQLALIERIESAIPGAEVELQEHTGYRESTSTDDDERYEIIRHSLKVTVTIGELTLSRQFAA